MLSLHTFAQNKSAVRQDVIQKINGEEMKGRLTKISDTDVTFIYSGETLEYTIKKSDILKITHSSGRVEVFGPTALPAASRQKDQVAMTASPVDHHNKIAILPFTFLMDNQPGAEQVGYKTQSKS